MSDNMPGMTSDVVQYLLAGGAGMLGRGMQHIRMAQKGNRKPWGWIVADMLIALGIGWAALGLCDWFGIPFKATQSIAILAGWGGPHLIDQFIAESVRKMRSGQALDPEG